MAKKIEEEIRVNCLAYGHPLQIRSFKDGETETKKIIGYAAVFNRWSEDLGGFREKIDPGAFAKTILSADVRALWNHDPNFVLGRTKSGTLGVAEDQTGLRIEVRPPDTQWARDLVVSIERGDVSEMSFAFRTITDEWTENAGELQRTLKEVELLDVSPVTYPAYPDTTVAMRSKDLFLAQTAKPEPEHQEPAEIAFPNLVVARMRMTKSKME